MTPGGGNQGCLGESFFFFFFFFLGGDMGECPDLISKLGGLETNFVVKVTYRS